MRDNHNRDECVAALAADLTEALRGLWHEYDPPSDPYCAQLVRDIDRGRARPGEMIAALIACAVKDRRPRAALEAPARHLFAYIGAHVAPMPQKPLPVLHRIEQQHDAALDLAQMRALTESGRGAQRECLERVRDYREFLGVMERCLEHHVYRITPASHAGRTMPRPAA